MTRQSPTRQEKRPSNWSFCALFVDFTEECRDERIPSFVLARVVKSWAVRFGNRYLLEQILFEPYPLELVYNTDSGKVRDGR
jgi:uncharacterized protein YbgA (DUF1722 family)